MFISSITIDNFKCIKEPVRIELKPITLLFGANSVGKSTIIQAVHFAREIFQGSGVNIDYTKTGGNQVKLGGFSNFIHNHDKDNIIHLRLDFDVPGHQKDDIDSGNIDLGAIEIQPLELASDEEHQIQGFFVEQIKNDKMPWLELHIQYDDTDNSPYISLGIIGFGDKEFMTVGLNNSNPYSLAELVCLDVDHTIFPTKEGKSIARIFIEKQMLDSDGICDSTKCTAQCASLLPMTSGVFNRIGGSTSSEDEKEPESPLTILATITQSIWLTVVGFAENDLLDFRYLGPLRAIPELPFDPDTQGAHDWDEGLAAWTYMALGSKWDLGIVNSWLSSEEDTGYKISQISFNTEYHLVREQYKELDIESSLYKEMLNSSEKTCNSEIKNVLDALPVKTRLFLKSIHSDISLQPKDIGVGISQVLPIIPLACGGGWDHDGIIAIEQPELHIHPAMQVVLGDLFIEGLEYENNMMHRKRLLIETHSEHLLLRLLRRIREPISDGISRSDDLGIYYLESSNTGVKATRLHVDKDGEFQNEWPDGFFEEREDELL